MSAFSEKIQKTKGTGFFRVSDFESVREYTHTIGLSARGHGRLRRQKGRPLL